MQYLSNYQWNFSQNYNKIFFTNCMKRPRYPKQSWERKIELEKSGFLTSDYTSKYSIQNGMVLSEKKKNRSIEQDREPRGKPKYLWSPSQWQRSRKYTIMPGASTGDPTHDKVMWRRPDNQGRSGLKGLPGPARASTLKPKSVCLLFTILCFSPTLLTLTGGYPQPPFSEENQLRALVNKSSGLERSISILTPLLAF